MSKQVKIPVNEPQQPVAPEVQSESTTKSELDKVCEERDKYLDLLRRTQADFENYQKRSLRDAETERRYAQKALALEVLPAIDNLDRFLTSVTEENDLSRAVVMVQKQLLDGLSRQGIKRMKCVGQLFDPNLHEAIMQQPSDQKPDTILVEAEAGYTYHDRVLRPAKVVIAKAAD
ncbi:MAG: nucleotide exchange factor GrpE [Planctomycetia bacterium]|nr:nucleotide exchange factor GrpE [Planctomycetia bacterium]